MKYKSLIILILLSLIICFSRVTYSLFHTETSLVMENREIAEFIFEANRTDEIKLNFEDLNPGDSKEFEFQVTNTKDNNITNVTTEYQITIKTFHFMPLLIELYKDDKVVMTCNENYSRNRNSDNALVCNSPIWELGHSAEITENFKIKVTFSSEYNSIEYSDLVDYIDVDMSSWQKIEE